MQVESWGRNKQGALNARCCHIASYVNFCMILYCPMQVVGSYASGISMRARPSGHRDGGGETELACARPSWDGVIVVQAGRSYTITSTGTVDQEFVNIYVYIYIGL
jgi:hypothetical protein